MLPSALLEALEHVVHRLLLGLALVLLKIRLQLLPGLRGIKKEFLAGAENQPAYITISEARGLADEACNLKVALGHGNIMAGGRVEVNPWSRAPAA